MKYEVFVALRYLRARRKQKFISLISFLSMLGVGLGVCALIVVLSVMSGFERQVKDKILGLNAHVMIYRAGGVVEDHASLAQLVARQPEVMAVTPFIYGQVMAVSEGGASGAVLRGIELDSALKVINLDDIMVDGKVADLGKPTGRGVPGVLLGAALARRLGMARGGIINLVNPLGEDTPVGRAPKSEAFQVVGVFESGLYQYDSRLCYISLSEAQAFMGTGDGVTGVELTVEDMYRANKVGLALGNILGPLYFVQDWMTTNHSLFSALRLEKIAMFVILTLIVLVAAFGIVSSLIMLVMEKLRDIAILKAMGATQRGIRRIFMLEGLIIGTVGTGIGIIFGLTICDLLARYQFIELPRDVYPMSSLPVDVEPLMVALVAVAAVFISLLATIYPARAAGGLDPVEGLRYQ